MRVPLRFAWPLSDLIAVVVFVAIGRHVHDHGVNLRGLASTTWPFAVGVVAGWLVASRWSPPMGSVRAGVVITLITVTLGMVLRVLGSQGTAIAFVMVALCFLGLFVIGPRLVANTLSNRRRT